VGLERGPLSLVSTIDRLCGLVGRVPEVRVRLPALPDFLTSTGSGSEYTGGVNGVICVAEKSCVSSEIRTGFLNIAAHLYTE
jgi:hypothetical protein